MNKTYINALWKTYVLILAVFLLFNFINYLLIRNIFLNFQNQRDFAFSILMLTFNFAPIITISIFGLLNYYRPFLRLKVENNFKVRYAKVTFAFFNWTINVFNVVFNTLTLVFLFAFTSNFLVLKIVGITLANFSISTCLLLWILIWKQIIKKYYKV